MDSEAERELMHLLSKDVLKQNLIKAGLFALAYELLKNSIIDKPRGFFTTGEIKPDHEYKMQVLAKHANPLIASCRWLQENNAITEADVRDVLQFREHRNYIAHELPNILLNPKVQVDEAKLVRLFQLLCKIDRWWITEVEISTNPEFDGQTINPQEVQSGSMMFIWHLIKVAYDLDDEIPDSVRPN
jgi:hypothetical protein